VQGSFAWMSVVGLRRLEEGRSGRRLRSLLGLQKAHRGRGCIYHYAVHSLGVGYGDERYMCAWFKILVMSFGIVI